MTVLVQIFVAFCIGVGALWGAQTLWLAWIMPPLLSQVASVPKPVVTNPKFDNLDMRKFHDALYPKFDVSGAGQRGATAAANRQIDLAIRAGNMVPRPPSYPGFPRR
jgi:hypothetical protein